MVNFLLCRVPTELFNLLFSFSLIHVSLSNQRSSSYSFAAIVFIKPFLLVTKWHFTSLHSTLSVHVHICRRSLVKAVPFRMEIFVHFRLACIIQMAFVAFVDPQSLRVNNRNHKFEYETPSAVPFLIHGSHAIPFESSVQCSRPSSGFAWNYVGVAVRPTKEMPWRLT